MDTTLVNSPPAPPPLYIIVLPTHAATQTWCVLKRNRYRDMVQVAEVTSYDSARAVIPSELAKRGEVFGLEFWEK
jgi:hypothetical protein